MAKKKIDIELNIKAKKAGQDLKTVDQGLTGIGKAGKVAGGGFKVMGTAMKAAGIGIIVSLFGKLVEVLMKNQKFMDAMNKIFLALEPILMMVAEVIAVVVEGLAEMIGSTMSAVSGTQDLTGALVTQKNEVKLLEAELGLLQLQYQKEAELMRQIRDDESLSIEERIDANFELGKILEEQLENERFMAEQSLVLAEMELARNKDNIELQVQLIEAKTKMAEIDERITGQRSEQLTNLNSLNREREAQQKEAAQAREEQLKKEAQMLQDLIDLQNEDIAVTKKKFRTINEQFNNAEEQNQAQLDELNRLMEAELKAHEISVANAKANIIAQEEKVGGLKEEVAATEESNRLQEERAARAQAEIDLVGDAAAAWATGFVPQIQEISEATLEQIKIADESTSASVAIVSNATAKKIEIEEKYAAKIKETEESLVVTTDTLQKQADEALFLHFETTRDKEIRLAEEKYDKLIGLAEGNAEATQMLEQQKADAIVKINQKESKALIKNLQTEMKLRAAKAKARKELEVTSAQESLTLAVGLTREGTAAYKAMASAETIMATYTGASKALADVPSPLNFVQAGLIIATGMKNLAEINKTKVPGPNETMPDTVTDLAGGDMAGGVPSINFGDAGINVPPVQAFVVETDISNAQALQSELDLQSTL